MFTYLKLAVDDASAASRTRVVLLYALIPAVLTSERVLPQNILAAFFVKKPAKPDVVWPADIQKTASAQTR